MASREMRNMGREVGFVAWPVPWDKLDPEIRELVRLLNATGVVKTIGSSAGHKPGDTAEVLMVPRDDGRWEFELLPTLCRGNLRLTRANVEVWRRHWLPGDGRMNIQWWLRIEVHPTVPAPEWRAERDEALWVVQRTVEEYIARDRVGAPFLEPQRQTCKVCDRQDKMNFHVPDDVWREVVPPEFQNRVVCLACFDAFARRREVDYAASLQDVCFAGDQATFSFSIDRARDRAEFAVSR